MPPQTLESGVTTLEVEMKELRELPAQVADLGLQIVQLRTELRREHETPPRGAPRKKGPRKRSR